jgi:hypothetical protein
VSANDYKVLRITADESARLEFVSDGYKWLLMAVDDIGQLRMATESGMMIVDECAWLWMAAYCVMVRYGY